MSNYNQKLYQRAKTNRGSMNLPSLVDVVFLLITFFLLTTSFKSVLNKLDLELPKARAVTEQIKRDTVIEIGADGQMAFNGELVTIQELDKQLADTARNSQEEIIVIRGDKGVAYGEVIKVMGICKSHGLSRLAMAALQEDGEE